MGIYTDQITTKPIPTASPKPPRGTIRPKVVKNTTAKQDVKRAINHDSVIALIRSVIRKPGRETAYHRLTPDEKSQLEDIIYTYKKQGYKLSENEIARIAINWLMIDYKQNGKNSILDLVIESMIA